MIDLDFLERTYFWFDKPVKYLLKGDVEVTITPVSVEDSEMFVSWIDIISIDKNALSNPLYISMSYLEFLVSAFFSAQEEELRKLSITKFVNILKLCLGFDGRIDIKLNERQKPTIVYGDIVITAKEFEDIRRIILYQNLLDFDDSYVNPDVKQAVDEVNEMKNKGIESPTLERKMAIITAHTGLSKKVQMEMTFRSHNVLFREVYGEVEYTSARTGIMVGNMFAKKKIDMDDWIYKKKKNKYEDYFVAQDEYSNSMGGAKNIHATDNASVDLTEFSSLIK